MSKQINYLRNKKYFAKGASAMEQTPQVEETLRWVCHENGGVRGGQLRPNTSPA